MEHYGSEMAMEDKAPGYINQAARPNKTNVTTALIAIDKTFDGLRDTVDILLQRLEPILGPEGPAIAPDVPERALQCNVANQIDNVSEQMIILRQRVMHALDRLEI